MNVKAYFQGSSKAVPILRENRGPVPPSPKRVVLPKKKIGARIRAWREQRGLSQSELARKIDTAPQSMWQIETGVRGISVQQLIKLGRALDASMDDILGQGKRTRAPVPLPRSGRRLARRIRQIQALPAEHQDAVVEMLDAFLKTHRGNGQGR
jgi:transcriptional regulator with XRE-family HTH domain